MRRWLEVERVIVASRAHTMAARLDTHRQLADATWILRVPASGARQAADAWLLEHLGPLQVQYGLGRIEAIKRLGRSAAGFMRHCVG